MAKTTTTYTHHRCRYGRARARDYMYRTDDICTTDASHGCARSNWKIYYSEAKFMLPILRERPTSERSSAAEKKGK
uniref:Uncharacterized protein n=1 Tax=Trichogramma kaykai TaxID=54128 RepID=A0ABD2XN18_9HYME